jgi:hypothetical protein
VCQGLWSGICETDVEYDFCRLQVYLFFSYVNRSRFREAIEKETDLDVLCELLNGIANCVENFGETIVSAQDLQGAIKFKFISFKSILLLVMFALIHEQLKKYDKRRVERERVNHIGPVHSMKLIY